MTTSFELKLRNAAPDTEYSTEFLQGMLNRMAVSWAKYGNLAEGVAKRDNIASLKLRLERYLLDGNTEWLMDVANFAMIEFMFPSHPDAHFRATSADESPGRVTVNGDVTAARNEAV